VIFSDSFFLLHPLLFGCMSKPIETPGRLTQDLLDFCPFSSPFSPNLKMKGNPPPNRPLPPFSPPPLLPAVSSRSKIFSKIEFAGFDLFPFPPPFSSPPEEWEKEGIGTDSPPRKDSDHHIRDFLFLFPPFLANIGKEEFLAIEASLSPPFSPCAPCLWRSGPVEKSPSPSFLFPPLFFLRPAH